MAYRAPRGESAPANIGRSIVRAALAVCVIAIGSITLAAHGKDKSPQPPTDTIAKCDYEMCYCTGGRSSQACQTLARRCTDGGLMCDDRNRCSCWTGELPRGPKPPTGPR